MGGVFSPMAQTKGCDGEILLSQLYLRSCRLGYKFRFYDHTPVKNDFWSLKEIEHDQYG
jgi:hypothetical protein